MKLGGRKPKEDDRKNHDWNQPYASHMIESLVVIGRRLAGAASGRYGVSCEKTPPLQVD
jgi:hypothetical protein